MNKAELVEELASQTGFSKTDSKSALEAFINIIEKTLQKGDSVVLTGFGSFSVVQRKAKTGVNPITKKPMKIAAKKVAKFKPGKELKESLN